MPLSPLHTTLILATSADGKIADSQRRPAQFSSDADLNHLETQVAAADAVLTGGGTLRAYGSVLPVRQARLFDQRRQRGQPDQPLQVVWSPSGNLDPQSRFFQQPVPRGLLTTATGASPWWDAQPGFTQIWAMPATSDTWDWYWVYDQLAQAGIKHLALLGGGYLVAELMAQNLVDEIYLTICPIMLGGGSAPTAMDGPGFTIPQAPRLTLLSSHTLDQEIFLHYQVKKPPQSQDDQ